MQSLKSYIKSPRTAVASVTQRFLTWLPDRAYLRLLFWAKMGKKLDLDNPKTFNEKLQWLKLYNRHPEYTRMVDKYAVKQLVAERVGEQYVIPTLGVWERFDDIDFDKLPDKFVLKTTHGGGGSGVVLCRDKATFDKADARRRLEASLRGDIYRSLREWPYKDVPKRILAEALLEEGGTGKAPRDYKFFVCQGEVKFLKVDYDRFENHQANYYDPDFNILDFSEEVLKSDHDHPQEMPEGFEQMKQMVETLAKDIPFARVDLYNINGRHYFGEITFYPASGLGKFSPVEWDEKLGKLITLPNMGGYLVENQNVTLKCKPTAISQSTTHSLTDYKFYCFNGVPQYVMLCVGRDKGVKFYFYNRQWELCRINHNGQDAPVDFSIPKPEGMDEMWEMAERLSQNLPHVRVDLYDVDGHPYFGELTFFTSSGFDNGLIDTTDRLLGDSIKLPEKP